MNSQPSTRTNGRGSAIMHHGKRRIRCTYFGSYALPPLSREERAARAKLAIGKHFNSKQQAIDPTPEN